MKKFYLLGIGGVSMSALAIMLKNNGNVVGGCDEKLGKTADLLSDFDISVDIPFDKEKLLRADVVVYSSAIKEDNLEFKFAVENNKKLMTRGQLLGEIASGFDKVIAVAGSHGKTTTTAMIYQILKVAGYNSTLHLGGFKLDDGKNFHLGENEYFVTEACEYHDNFLNLTPTIAVITNVEKEHMDYFHTFENQLNSFEKFKNKSQNVICSTENFKAKNIRHDKAGNLSFNLFDKDKKIITLHLQIMEEINTQNCVYAYQVAKLLNLPDCIIKQGLESYKGVTSRFEKRKSPYFETVICDYAHHPTELSKAIKTAKKIFKGRRLVTIFQPHTYSRTKDLLPEFLKVFKSVELPLFFKTYAAREKPEEGLSAEELTEILKKDNKNAEYFENYTQIFDFLKDLDFSNDVLLFLGAGDLPDILHKNNFIS